MAGHGGDQLGIGPLRILQAELVIRRAAPAQQSRGLMPISLSTALISAPLGGVFT